MNINNKFELEEIVFLITDTEQKERIVTGLKISKNNIVYYLSCGTEETIHYEFEIASDKVFKL